MLQGEQKPAVDSVPLPSEILQHVTDASGSHVVLVVGAGVSMEPPTGLQSGAYYSREAHRRLTDDEVLGADECTEPEDLSVLADLIYDKFGSQAHLTSRLPKNEWRTAKPNAGHHIAVALLMEGALRHVITLNYDLAFQHAATDLGSGSTVTFVEGPEEHANLGSHSVVHLHRSVNQPEESWVLRKQALDNDWANEWESVIASANLSAPVVVFVGLGSPANVLTESVRNLSQKSDSSYYLVDRAERTKFHEALGDNLSGTVPLYWGEFMQKLGQRVVKEQVRRVQKAFADLVRDDTDLGLQYLGDIAEPIQNSSLLDLGRARAIWLLEPCEYAAEGAQSRQAQIAHLLLAVDTMAAAVSATEYDLDANGQFTLSDADGKRLIFGLAHGGGTSGWSGISRRVRERNNHLAPPQRMNFVVVAGARSARVSPVDDLVRQDASGDLIRGADEITPIFADDFISGPVNELRRAIDELRS